MGAGPSKPSCAISKRALLNVQNAKDILTDCAKQRIAYVWGVVFIFTLTCLVGYLLTQQHENESPEPRKNFFVPLWLTGVPILGGLVYTFRLKEADLASFKTEELEFSLSDMTKRDYLQYRANDDRTQKSFFGTATSAGILSGTNILGPFLRGDR
jgi:hypothetical protein